MKNVASAVVVYKNIGEGLDNNLPVMFLSGRETRVEITFLTRELGSQILA